MAYYLWFDDFWCQFYRFLFRRRGLGLWLGLGFRLGLGFACRQNVVDLALEGAVFAIHRQENPVGRFIDTGIGIVLHLYVVLAELVHQGRHADIEVFGCFT